VIQRENLFLISKRDIAKDPSHFWGGTFRNLPCFALQTCSFFNPFYFKGLSKCHLATDWPNRTWPAFLTLSIKNFLVLV
jgi:hypothetical protein